MKPIPEQHQGKSSDVKAEVLCHSVAQAENMYMFAKKRLQLVSEWNAFDKNLGTSFSLCNQSGELLSRPVLVGDYLRIDIPGPGSLSGSGFDWVRVEDLGEELNAGGKLFFMRVRPAQEPGKAGEAPAHFFEDGATSSFIVKMEGNTVSAEVHGRNELPNLDARGLTDIIRNTIVGTLGSLGLSAVQWKRLTAAIMDIHTDMPDRD